MRIPAEERLTNLVVALMATEIGLTRQQILEAVSGYRQRTAAGARPDSIERMFERDKEELRSLGVPLQTLADPADPANLRNARYRIPQAEYNFPEDIDFTAEELSLLHLAGSVWGAGSLSEDASAGVRKIRALGIDGDEPVIGLAPRILVREVAFAPLHRAIENTQNVSFDYLRPGSSAARERLVSPLALIEYESRWHIYGLDLELGEPRTFLLSRIVSAVRPTGSNFEATLRAGAGERALAGLERLASEQVAIVEVQPGSESALRLRPRAQTDVDGSTPGSGSLRMRIPFVDIHIFADELAGAGPEVRVLAPDALRNAVVRRLELIMTAHADVTLPGERL